MDHTSAVMQQHYNKQLVATNTNTITFDEPEPFAESIQNIIVGKNRKSSTKRHHHPNHSRNNAEKKERNKSAMLPKLERNRYSTQHETSADANMLNFVSASRKQMKDVIGQSKPMAKRFFDDSLINNETKNESSHNVVQKMPNFSNSQMARVRPSIQSVKASNNRHKMDINLQSMNEEISELASSRRMDKALQQKKKMVESKLGLLSPRGLFANPSKASLQTEIYQVDQAVSFKSPGSVHTFKQATHHSPTASSMMNTLSRELKHIQKYLDTREMQIRQELESAKKLDKQIESNKSLDDLYHQVMTQVRTKLPVGNSAMSDLVKRIMEGLRECFQLQEKNFAKKVDIRNKKIDSLNNELKEVKEDFYEFSRTQTVDAFFKKHTDVVNRTGRREKDYIKDINKVVDDFLGQDDMFAATQMDDEREATKDAEPSGAETMLIQLSQQATTTQEMPIISENPLIAMDLEKDELMTDFKKTLKFEAHGVRAIIEKHVKTQLGLIKPMTDSEAQTTTFRVLRNEMEDQIKDEIETKANQRAELANKIRTQRLNKDYEALQAKNSSLKEKAQALQDKLASVKADVYLDQIKEKIFDFFNQKLGKKQRHIIDEFRENIMQITKVEQTAPADLLASISSFHGSDPGAPAGGSEASKRRAANKFEHLMKSSDSRGSLASQEEINILVKQSTKMAKTLSTQRSNMSVGNFDKEQDQINEMDEDEDQIDTKLTNTQEIALKKMATGNDKSGTKIEVQNHNNSDDSQQEELVESERLSENDPEETKDAPEIASPRKVAVKSPDQSEAGQKSPSTMKGTAKSFKKANKSVSPAKVQDEAPPQIQVQQAAPQPAAEPDNRQELMDKLASIKSVTKSLKEFQSSDKLKSHEKKAEQLVASLSRVQASAETAYRILKLNSDDTSLVGDANLILTSAQDMGKSIEKVKATLSKIRSGAQMHKLIDKINKFIKGSSPGKQSPKKGKDSPKKGQAKKEKELPTTGELPDKEKILGMLNSLDQVNDLTTQLPSKQEIEQVGLLDKNANDVEGKVTQLLTKKFVKPPPPPTVIQAPAPEPIIIEKEAPPREKQDDITEAIDSITLVQSQVEESHSVLLMQQKQASKQEQKAITKVKKLLNHMTEAIEWLNQQKEDGGSQIIVGGDDESDESDENGDQMAEESNHEEQQSVVQKQPQTQNIPAVQDREKALKQTGKNQQTNKQQTNKHQNNKQQKRAPTKQNLNNDKNIDSSPQNQPTHNFDADQWSQNDESQTPISPPPPELVDTSLMNIDSLDQQIDSINHQDRREMGLRKSSQQFSEDKIMQVQKNAQIYLAEQDIETVNEDTKREQDASKFSVTPAPTHVITHNPDEAMLLKNENESLGQIGEEQMDGDSQNNPTERNSLFKRDRGSRVEVYRKTPAIQHTEGDELTLEDDPQSEFGNNQKPPQVDVQQQIGYQQTNSSLSPQQRRTSMGESSPPILIAQQSAINANATGNRKQFAELLQMGQTFSSVNAATNVNKLADNNPQVNKINRQRDIAVNLRQSGAETDYLKTASHFGIETVRNDPSKLNVGITNAGNNHNPNDTNSFLHNLQSQVAVDLKRPSQPNKKTKMQHKIVMNAKGEPKHVKNQAMQITTPTLNLNEDLQDTNKHHQQQQQYMDSQASSIADQDLSFQDTPLQTAFDTDERRNKAAKHVKRTPQGHIRSPRDYDPDDPRRKAPSALKISKKPYHQHIKMEDTGDFHYVEAQPRYGVPRMASKHPAGSVLMLTQETQTENRSLIKYLLTLINETMMKQLEDQSVKMTKEEFLETIESVKQVIPAVYDKVREQSDTFFIDEQLGPSYTTANLNETSASLLQQSPSNQDLMNLMDGVHGYNQNAVISNGGVLISKKQLSPAPSMRSLSQVPSQPRLYSKAGIGTHDSPTNSASQLQLMQQPQCAKHQPFLSLGDFSRYGNHTLELSQEVKTRVNLRQIGAAGGGFMGKPVKVFPPREQYHDAQLR